MGQTRLESALAISLEDEVTKITNRLREVLRDFRKRGLVIAVSGGIDSSVSAALATRAVGPGKIFALMLPEKESSAFSTNRGKMLVEHLGVPHIVHDIAPALEGIGCYRARDEALAECFPDYKPIWKHKIVIAGGTEGKYNYFKVIVETPEGERRERRLRDKQYLQIVAATNYKQRIRKTVEYYHADRLNYAVVGTPNRLEYDQGFFVKNGDGSADVKPIAHLYKTQVYAMARHLGLPDEVCNAVPTTDTYSLPQGQDEFYFALPYQQMDIALWAYNHGVPETELAAHLGISPERAAFIYRDIEAKRSATEYLASPPVLIEPIDAGRKK